MHETIWWLVLCFWNLVWTWSRLVKIELLSEQQVTWECRYLKRRQRSPIESKNKRWRVFFRLGHPIVMVKWGDVFYLLHLKVKRLPTLPAAVIQIILCIGQIGDLNHFYDFMNEWEPYTTLSVGLYTACLLRPQPHRERLAWTWCLLSPNLRPHQLLGRLFVHRPFLVPLSS